MPQPIYILCSEAGVRDAQTGLVSHFNVIEKLALRRLPRNKSSARPLVVASMPIRISAAWMRGEGDDPGQEYEHETLLIVPQDQQEFIVGSGRFRFRDLRHHIITNARHYLMPGLGMIRVVNRIRKVGDLDWLSQEYPILAEAHPSEYTESSAGTEESDTASG